MTTSTVPAAACAGCGAALSAGALFCLSCGAPAPRDLREQRETTPRRKAWFDIEPVPEPVPPPAPAPAPEQETAPLTFDDARPAGVGTVAVGRPDAEPEGAEVVEPEVVEPVVVEPEPEPELTEEQREVARLEAIKREAEVEYQLLKAKWAADEQERKRLAALQPPPPPVLPPVVVPAAPPVAPTSGPLSPPEPVALPEPLSPPESVVDESVVDEPVLDESVVDEPLVDEPVRDTDPAPVDETLGPVGSAAVELLEPPTAPADPVAGVPEVHVAGPDQVAPEPVVTHEAPTLPGLETLPAAEHVASPLPAVRPPSVPATAPPVTSVPVTVLPATAPTAVDPTRSGSDARGVADEFEDRIERSPFFGDRPTGKAKGRGRGRAAVAGSGGSSSATDATAAEASGATGRSTASTGSGSLELDNPDDLIGSTLPTSGRRWFRRPAPPREPVVSSFDAPPSTRVTRRPAPADGPAATPDVPTSGLSTSDLSAVDVPASDVPAPDVPASDVSAAAKPDPANLPPASADPVPTGPRRKPRAKARAGVAAPVISPVVPDPDTDTTAAPVATAPVATPAASVTPVVVAAPVVTSSKAATPTPSTSTAGSSSDAPRNVLKADPKKSAPQSSLATDLDDPDADARHLARYSTARWLTAMVVVAGLLGAGVVLLLWSRGGDQVPPTNTQAQAQSLQLAAVRAWQQGNAAWAAGDIATVCTAYDGVGVGGLWLDRVSCIASEQQGFDKSPAANRAQVGRMTFDPRLAEIVDGDAVVIWLSKATLDGQPVTLFRADDFAVMRVLPGQGWRQVGARYSGNVVGTVPRQLAATSSGNQSSLASPFPGSTPGSATPAASPGLTQPTPTTPTPTEPVPSGTSALFG